MALRDLATAWVRANCPRPDVQQNFLQHLDDAIQRSVNCSFMIGRDLTKIGKPFLVYCFRDEVFAWALTPQQAARLAVADNMLVCAASSFVDHSDPKNEPAVWLEHVEIDSAEALDRSQPITGTLHYRTAEFIADPLAIQAMCEPPGRPSTILFHHLHGLIPPQDEIRFSLPPLGDMRDDQGTQFVGVVPLFFQICMAPRPPQPAFSCRPSPIPSPLISALHPWPATPHSPTLMPMSQTNPAWSPLAATPTPAMPVTLPYPPTYDPGSAAAPPIGHERPISDIRAVLVEVV